jgi:hypothetical protein
MQIDRRSIPFYQHHSLDRLVQGLPAPMQSLFACDSLGTTGRAKERMSRARSRLAPLRYGRGDGVSGH